MKIDPIPFVAAPSSVSPCASARAEAHVRHIRLHMDKLHAAVAGDVELEAIADRLHAHLGAALATAARVPGMSRLGVVFPFSGGTDPGPKPSEREAWAAEPDLA